MKIVALTDVHGAYGIVRSILEREAPFDAVVIGGDLTTRGTPEEAEAAIRSFGAFGSPVVVVAGNMDSPEVERAMGDAGLLIDGKGVVLEGVGFFGVSASPPTPMHTPYEIPEEEILKRSEAGWSDLGEATIRVFVPHAPPWNTRLDVLRNGAHAGSVSVRRVVESLSPDVVICGHIHESRGMDRLGRTHMMNCGPASDGKYGVVLAGETLELALRD